MIWKIQQCDFIQLGIVLTFCKTNLARRITNDKINSIFEKKKKKAAWKD